MSSQRIQHLREEFEYTQEFVAEYLECSRSTYTNWETGNIILPLEVASKLAVLYNVPLSFILGVGTIHLVDEHIKKIDYDYLRFPYIPPEGANVYVVQSGDSLWSIARKLNLTVEELKAANNLTSNNLSIGQRLRIPVSETPITYVVKSGDNLYAIARQYNTTVNEIKRKNNLTSNNLSIGQILVI